ncbi:MAG: hypothetical protein II931_02115 [Clostridia bacterium]|nr:hypothetical protein [Clostridia bacterium]
MKKILSLIAAVSVMCCLAACSKTPDEAHTAEEDNTAVSADESPAESKVCEFANVVFDIPGGFVGQNDSETFKNYVTENYPEVPDSISLSRSAETLDDYSEDNLNMLMQQLNERAERNIYGDEGCIDYRQYTIDGHDAVSYKSEITADDTLSVQTQVVVFFDDGAVIISFSSISGEYDEEFAKSVDSIKIKG